MSDHDGNEESRKQANNKTERKEDDLEKDWSQGNLSPPNFERFISAAETSSAGGDLDALAASGHPNADDVFDFTEDRLYRATDTCTPHEGDHQAGDNDSDGDKKLPAREGGLDDPQSPFGQGIDPDTADRLLLPQLSPIRLPLPDPHSLNPPRIEQPLDLGRAGFLQPTLGTPDAAKLGQSATLNESTPDSGLGGILPVGAARPPVPDPVNSTAVRTPPIQPSEELQRKHGRAEAATKTWFMRFNELSEYNQEHGNCNVPQSYEKNKALGTWVNKQRQLKKLLDRGEKSGILDHEKKKLLDGIGFDWQLLKKGDAAWHSRYQQLREYVESHGNANVPTKYQANSKLGRWVSTQRNQYKDFQEGKRSIMTQERVTLLEKVGFAWKRMGAASRETSPSSAAAESQPIEPSHHGNEEAAGVNEGSEGDEEEQAEVTGEDEADNRSSGE